MNNRIVNSTTETIAALFILLFLYTGLSKLYDHKHFEVVLGNSPLLSKFSSVISWAMPILECHIAFLLFFAKTRFLGLWASFVLMSLFTVYIAYMLTYTSELPCSCGGVLKQLNWKEHLLFNIGFTLLAFLGIMLHIVNHRSFKNKNIAATIRTSRKPV